MENKTKYCKNCNKEKLISEFYITKSTKTGFSLYCKECNRLRAREYYNENKEKSIDYREKNRERINKNSRNRYSKRYPIDRLLLKKHKSELKIKEYIEKNKGVLLSSFVNWNSKIKIKCSCDNIFEPTPNNLINKQTWCKSCSSKKGLSEIKEIYFQKILDIIKEKKFELVDENIVYNGCFSDIELRCDKGHIFKTKPIYIKDKNGICCKFCNESIGERDIRLFLEKRNIKYEFQKTFDGCIHIKKLYFDFYLPEYNTCIEYDGEQHFKEYRFTNKNVKDQLNKRIIRDEKKTKFCIDNGIKLIRIRYNQKVEEVLDQYYN